MVRREKVERESRAASQARRALRTGIARKHTARWHIEVTTRYFEISFTWHGVAWHRHGNNTGVIIHYANAVVRVSPGCANTRRRRLSRARNAARVFRRFDVGSSSRRNLCRRALNSNRRNSPRIRGQGRAGGRARRCVK